MLLIVYASSMFIFIPVFCYDDEYQVGMLLDITVTRYLYSLFFSHSSLVVSSVSRLPIGCDDGVHLCSGLKCCLLMLSLHLRMLD